MKTVAAQVAEFCGTMKHPDFCFHAFCFGWCFILISVAYGLGACALYLTAQLFGMIGDVVAQFFSMLEWAMSRYDAMLIVAAGVLFVLYSKRPPTRRREPAC